MQSRSIAVDPGYDRVGIAIFEQQKLIFSECFVPQKGAFPLRLHALYTHIRALIKKHQPQSMALETLFFTKNQKTAMRVAEARGVIQLAAEDGGLEIIEYSPQSVKIAVTGSGNAAKDGVMRMIEKLLVLSPKKRRDDEYDAIALGLAHVYNKGFLNNIHKAR